MVSISKHSKANRDREEHTESGLILIGMNGSGFFTDFQRFAGLILETLPTLSRFWKGLLFEGENASSQVTPTKKGVRGEHDFHTL